MTDATPLDAARPGADRRAGRLGLVFLLLIGLAAAVGAALTLEYGTLQQPGPGFWITWIAVADVALCVAALLMPAVAADGVEPLERAELRAVLRALPALLLAVPLLGLVGATVTTLLVSFYWMKVPLSRSWLASASTSAALTTGIYIIFIVLLRVPFPTGTLIGI